ncbi:lymphotactin-like [Anomaloglossus baeobatrachus]|uniref:lymphotactin-like n=1 Tax=Anomaloglossus baeobatrachus TaxID=238106 RepID=UPI003F509CA7
MKLYHIPLLTFIGLVLSATQSHGLEVNFTDVYDCSEVQTRKVDIKILKSYTIEANPIDAVLFSTKNGTKICADPNEAWVKEAIVTLDKQTATHSPKTGAKNGSKRTVKKTAKKSPKAPGKKSEGKKKRKPQPREKTAPVMSRRNILAPRRFAGKP